MHTPTKEKAVPAPPHDVKEYAICMQEALEFTPARELRRLFTTNSNPPSPLPFKTTVSKTTAHDPPPHDKALQMPTPTRTTLLFTTIKSG